MSSQLDDIISVLPLAALIALRDKVDKRINLSTPSLGVGSSVMFKHDGSSHYGWITKINPANHTVKIVDSEQYTIGKTIRVPKDWLQHAADKPNQRRT